MSAMAIRGTVVAIYFAVVLAIGAAAFRRSKAGSAEDYFLGGRTAKTLVLFMALFGTNITPFVLMGIPGRTYHVGVGELGRNAAIIVLGIPLTFWAIGYPAWIAARRLRVVTPAELYARRFSSPAVGLLLFLVFFVYTVPYMVTAVSGVGIAVSVLTDGRVPFEAAAAGILLITIAYTSTGGMRATMWTNVFQGAVFLGFTVFAFFAVAADLGGLSEVMARVQQEAPKLLVKGQEGPYAPGAYASWGLAISLTVIAFPHMLVRIFAAKDATALKNACRYYPLAMVLLWVPAVLFGVWGAVDMPGLQGRASDSVFPMMVRNHMGPAMQGLALAGILAAVMSTLDAQMLTLSSMLGRDVARPYFRLREDSEVRLGRIFVVLLAVLTYVIALAKIASIFEIAKIAFFGYCTVVPTLFLGLRWRGFNRVGAIVSILLGNVTMLAAVAGVLPAFGLLPVVWGLVGASLGAVVGSAMGSDPDPSATEAVLGPIEQTLGSRS